GHGRVPTLRQADARRSPHRRRGERAHLQAMRRGDRRRGALAMKAGLKERYDKTLKDELRKQFSYPNIMQVPRVEKVILNIGMGEAIGNAKAMDAAAQDLATITGQRPIVTKSRRAIPNFPLRDGIPTGPNVTLRGERMWHFLATLVTGSR